MGIKIDVDQLSQEIQGSVDEVRSTLVCQQEFNIGQTADGLFIYVGVRDESESDDDEIACPCVVETD